MLLNTAHLVEKQQIFWISLISSVPIFMVFEKGTIFYTTLFCFLYNTILWSYSVQHDMVKRFSEQHCFLSICRSCIMIWWKKILNNTVFCLSVEAVSWYGEKIFWTTLFFCLSVEAVSWYGEKIFWTTLFFVYLSKMYHDMVKRFSEQHCFFVYL